MLHFLAARFKRPSKPQVISSLLSITVLTLALTALWFGQFLPKSSPDDVVIREISVSMPPPPPPAPPVQQEVVDTPLTLQIEGTGITLPKIEIKKPIEKIKPNVPVIETSPSEWQSLAVDWQAFSLNQLDALPKLLTTLKIKLPKKLSRQGIKKVLIKLDILIDVDGQVSLVNIVENPYPALIGEINNLVRNSRFTPPSKDNEAVRARFIWPVEINS